MGSKLEACDECSRNCSLIHRKHDPSAIVWSFFKVMFGKHFCDFVTVPPRFARLTSLVARETFLEDSCGRKSHVSISDINGSLVIKRGWNEFSVDHGIEVGDFVVFHYIMGSHFIVQIYGTHGCEKLSLSGESTYKNKRDKTTEMEIDDIPSQDDVNKLKEPPVVEGEASGLSKASEKLNKISSSDFVDDTQFISNQDVIAREDDRDHLLDLSVFEKPIKIANPDESCKTSKLRIQGYRCSQVFDALLKAEVGAASNSNFGKKYNATEGNTFKGVRGFTSKSIWTSGEISTNNRAASGSG